MNTSSSTAASHFTTPSAVDTGINLANTVIAIVKDVGEILNNVPYVKSLSGVVLQIIKIRDEIKSNKQRCNEIIDKVVRISKSIYERLAEIAQSKGRDRLGRLEGHLAECNVTLSAVSVALEKHKSRKPFNKFINRGLEELNEMDRRIDELNIKLILDILVDLKLEQATSAVKEDRSLASIDLANASDHMLPAKPRLMFERDGQLERALSLLLGAEPSRIAILGGGGFGKTTLARTILHDPKICERYQSRYFLSCEGLPDVTTLLGGIGAMLGITASPSATLASARRILQMSRTLLCFDNFETTWEQFETRSEVEELLEAIADIPNLSLIITLRGEQRPSKVSWSKPFLPALSTLSLEGAKLIVENIAGNDAVDDFTLQLLQAVDGIPLAITLIATLLRDGENTKSLWRRWSAYHTQIIHVGDDRQSNLDRCIALSVNSVRMIKNPDARHLLAALSVLPVGFPIGDALERLQKHLAIAEIFTVLQTLRTVALIRLEDTGTSPRMQMLSPIRHFCYCFLAQEIEVVLPKIVDYYIELLYRSTISNSSDYKEVVPEIYNIHFVFQKMFTTASQDQDVEELIKATPELIEWSWYTGYYSEDTIRMALEKATHMPLLRGNCLTSLGALLEWKDQYAQAQRCYREAVELFKQEDAILLEAHALKDLGDNLLTMRQLDEAEFTLHASLEIIVCEDSMDMRTQADLCLSLGQLYMEMNKYSDAKEHFTSALEAYTRTSDLIAQANTTEHLSDLYIQLGDLVKAEEFSNKALAYAQQVNYVVGQGNAYMRLGEVYLLTSRLLEAEHILQKAMTIFTIQNHQLFNQLIAAEHIGRVCIQLDRLSAAEKLQLFNQLIAAEHIGRVYIQLDRLSAAEKLLTEYTRTELDMVWLPYILTVLGWLYFCGNHFEKAEHHLNNALHHFRKYEDKLGPARAMAYLGSVYLKMGKLDDTQRIVDSIPDLGAWQEIEMHRLWVLGDLQIIRGQFDDAEESLNSAMDAAKWRESVFQQGNILRSMGILNVKRERIDLAIKQFQEALEFHRKAQWVSEQAADLKQLSEAYKMICRPIEAEAAFEEAEKLMQSVQDIRVLAT